MSLELPEFDDNKKRKEEKEGKKKLTAGEERWRKFLETPAGKKEAAREIDHAIDIVSEIQRGPVVDERTKEERRRKDIEVQEHHIKSLYDLDKAGQIDFELSGDLRSDTRLLLEKVNATEGIKRLDKGEDPLDILRRIREFTETITEQSAKEDIEHYVHTSIATQEMIDKILNHYK